MWLKDEEDFEDWKDNITLLLGSRGLDDYIQPKDTSDTSDPEPKASKKKEIEQRMARMTCGISIRGSILRRVQRTSRGRWGTTHQYGYLL
jgi:hypothetical protein